MRASRCLVAGFIVGVTVTGAGACSEHPPSRCELTCRREQACARDRKDDYDLSECVWACAALDRDPTMQASVDRHVGCVEKAAGCEALLECR